MFLSKLFGIFKKKKDPVQPPQPSQPNAQATTSVPEAGMAVGAGVGAAQPGEAISQTNPVPEGQPVSGAPQPQQIVSPTPTEDKPADITPEPAPESTPPTPENPTTPPAESPAPAPEQPNEPVQPPSDPNQTPGL